MSFPISNPWIDSSQSVHQYILSSKGIWNSVTLMNITKFVLVPVVLQIHWVPKLPVLHDGQIGAKFQFLVDSLLKALKAATLNVGLSAENIKAFQKFCSTPFQNFDFFIDVDAVR